MIQFTMFYNVLSMGRLSLIKKANKQIPQDVELFL